MQVDGTSVFLGLVVQVRIICDIIVEAYRFEYLSLGHLGLLEIVIGVGNHI